MAKTKTNISHKLLLNGLYEFIKNKLATSELKKFYIFGGNNDCIYTTLRMCDDKMLSFDIHLKSYVTIFDTQCDKSFNVKFDFKGNGIDSARYTMTTDWDNYKKRINFVKINNEIIYFCIEKLTRIVIDALTYEIKIRLTLKDYFYFNPNKCEELTLESIDTTQFSYVFTDNYIKEIAKVMLIGSDKNERKIPHIMYQPKIYKKDDEIIIGRFDTNVYTIKIGFKTDIKSGKDMFVLKIYSEYDEKIKTLTKIKSTSTIKELITHILKYYYENSRG